MASVINPDNSKYIINGDVEVGGDINLTDTLRIDNINNIDLENLPASYNDADAALNVAGGAYIDKNLYVGGTFVANGDVVTLGNTGGSLVFSSGINSNIIPGANNTFNLGSQTNQWNNIHTKTLTLESQPSIINSTPWNNNASINYIDSTTPTPVVVSSGSNGEIKTLVCTETPAGSIVINPDNSLGFDNLIFDEAGQSVTMLFTNDHWVILSYYRTSVIL